jgi:hypothetical protein
MDEVETIVILLLKSCFGKYVSAGPLLVESTRWKFELTFMNEEIPNNSIDPTNWGLTMFLIVIFTALIKVEIWIAFYIKIWLADGIDRVHPLLKEEIHYRFAIDVKSKY